MNTQLTFWVYQDPKKHYRWQLVHQNTKIIANSGEGYVNKADCIHGINLVASTNGCPIKYR